eukprot:Phypoly_transcript_09470.p1 GENE.Phypoly_transcript_09470~~Phypoly_transcript_09470.p1  ORF type:complete len:308 (-),score=75.29 Phypoly_transcript_09470:402-1325(-)
MAASTEPTPQVVEGSVDTAETTTEPTPKTIVTLDSNGEHLLQSPWTFWFARKMPKANPSPVNYAEHLQKIASFNTVENFYKTYVYIARPLDLPKDSSFHMFKGDVVPMWESFPNGGSWIIKLSKKHPQLALLWEELVFYCVGEALEEPDIVGIVLNIRPKEYTIAVWNADSQNPALRARVAEKLKYFLRLDPATPIEYKANSASLRGEQKASHRNGKLVVPSKEKKKKKKANKLAAQAAAASASASASASATAAAAAAATANAAATAVDTAHAAALAAGVSKPAADAGANASAGASTTPSSTPNGTA